VALAGREPRARTTLVGNHPLMKAAIVAATIGGALAIIEGLLLIVLGSLAGLAENPDSEAARTDGFLVLALGGIILVAVLTARRWPIVIAAACASTAAIGFLIENALWIFAAACLVAAAALAVISKRGELRLAKNARPP
jgi:hypothetical protein